MLRIGLKLNKVAEVLKIKNPEIRKNPEESHPWVIYGALCLPDLVIH